VRHIFSFINTYWPLNGCESSLYSCSYGRYKGSHDLPEQPGQRILGLGYCSNVGPCSEFKWAHLRLTENMYKISVSLGATSIW
jgi:hypothetical protein